MLVNILTWYITSYTNEDFYIIIVWLCTTNQILLDIFIPHHLFVGEEVLSRNALPHYLPGRIPPASPTTLK